MAGIASRTVHTPDRVMPYGDGGRIGVFRVGSATIGRIELQPGWRWSDEVGPAEGEDSCQRHHEGYCLAGRLLVKMDDGDEREFGAGDLFVIEPGHDAWVVGDEPWIGLDFTGLEQAEEERAAPRAELEQEMII